MYKRQVDYLKSQSASTVKDFNKAQKQELFTYGQKAANVVGVTVSYDKATKTVSATDKNGNAIAVSYTHLAFLLREKKSSKRKHAQEKRDFESLFP